MLVVLFHEVPAASSPLLFHLSTILVALLGIFYRSGSLVLVAIIALLGRALLGL